MKTLFIFDFDDTLALTNSHVIVNDSLRLSTRDFAKYRAKPTDKLDFSEFLDVKDGTLIQSTVDAMQQAIDQHGYENVYIVTARSVAPPVKRFLSKMNIEVPEIVATSGSEGKARWLIQRLIKEDYHRVMVYEDCRKNIEMLKQVVDTYNEETRNQVDYSSVCVVLEEGKMKITRRKLRKMIAELSFNRDPSYESERWQQERLNKVQLEDKLEQIQQDLAPKGVELVILTDDESGSLADNEIKVIINRKKSGIMGMLGSEDSQMLMFYAWPNGVSVKDMDSGQDPLSLEPDQVDRWLQQNIIGESRILDRQLRATIRQILKSSEKKK